MELEHESFIISDPVESTTCPHCSTVLDVCGLPAFTLVQCSSCEKEFSVPSRLGNFLLLQLLGAGGMGGVYRALDEGLKREVAVKVMLKSLGDDPQFVQNFQREAQAAAQLNHPNIAQIYSFGQEKGQPYIVMELVSGGSLDKIISTDGSVAPAAAMKIGMQIAEGLQLAAEMDLVHGDIKPENILFDNEHNAKLVDFGLAAMISGPGHEVWGTPYYIAPEKVRRQKVDFRSDIYSLGGTLYHAIAGVAPFEGEDATAVVKARFENDPKPLRELRPDVPEAVDTIVLRMLARDVQTRYPTYGSLLSDMRRYLASVGPVRLKKSSRKIVLKGRKNTTGGLAAGSSGKITGKLHDNTETPPGMTPVSEIEEEPESAEEAGKRGRKILLGLFAGLLLIVGIVYGSFQGFKSYTTKKREQAEQTLIAQKQSEARTAIAKALEIARATVEKVKTQIPEADGLAEAATEEAVKALGEEARPFLKWSEPASAAPPEVAATPAQEEQPAPAPETKPDKEKGETPDPKTKDKKTPDTETDNPLNSHPLVLRVREMHRESLEIQRLSDQVDKELDEIQALGVKAESMTTVDKEIVEELVKTGNQLVRQVRDLGYNPKISELPRRILLLKKELQGVKMDVELLMEREREAEKVREEQRKREELKEKERQAQAEYAAKIEGEREVVKTAEETSLDDLKQLKFRDVTSALRKAGASLETREALGDLEVAQQRVDRVKEFHQYLVKQVNGFQSARGWSVDGADQRAISVGGRKIPWVEIYNQRAEIVNELINGVVLGEKVERSMRLRERTRLMTNAAICLHLFYKDIPSAQERARELAVQSANQFELDAEEIRKLLPVFFE